MAHFAQFSGDRDCNLLPFGKDRLKAHRQACLTFGDGSNYPIAIMVTRVINNASEAADFDTFGLKINELAGEYGCCSQTKRPKQGIFVHGITPARTFAAGRELARRPDAALTFGLAILSGARLRCFLHPGLDRQEVGRGIGEK
jgi:hypothetical protein